MQIEARRHIITVALSVGDFHNLQPQRHGMRGSVDAVFLFIFLLFHLTSVSLPFSLEERQFEGIGRLIRTEGRDGSGVCGRAGTGGEYSQDQPRAYVVDHDVAARAMR